MNNDDKIVKKLRDSLPPKIDYAELVGSPVPSSYGQRFVWDNPMPYMIEEAADLIESLQAQLAESQRRERAAVEDLNGTGACFTCKHFRRNGGDCFGAGRCRLDGIEIWPCNEPGVYRVEVPDDGRKTYEWRGPQEAGKGAAE